METVGQLAPSRMEPFVIHGETGAPQYEFPPSVASTKDLVERQLPRSLWHSTPNLNLSDIPSAALLMGRAETKTPANAPGNASAIGTSTDTINDFASIPEEASGPYEASTVRYNPRVHQKHAPLRQSHFHLRQW